MKLRVGVVGYGYWGSKHVRVLNSMPDLDVVIIEQDTDRLAEAGATFPSVALSRDVEASLKDVDALVIATSPSSHAPLAIAALEAGVHVLVEKPLATSAADAIKMIETAEQNDAVLMVGHTFEYNPSVRMLRDLVRSGDLGDVHYIDSARLNLGLYQPDVNVIWDLAPHDISITNYLLNSTADHVSAWATRHVPTEFEDVAYLQVGYNNPSVRSYVHVSWLDPRKVRRVTVVGSDKMAVYNDVDLNEPIRIYDVGVDCDPGQPIQDRPLVYRYGDISSPRVSGDEPLAIEDRHFIDCVRTGARPLTDGMSGLAVVETIEAAMTSARDAGRRVPINSPISMIRAGAVA